MKFANNLIVSALAITTVFCSGCGSEEQRNNENVSRKASRTILFIDKSASMDYSAMLSTYQQTLEKHIAANFKYSPDNFSIFFIHGNTTSARAEMTFESPIKQSTCSSSFVSRMDIQDCEVKQTNDTLAPIQKSILTNVENILKRPNTSKTKGMSDVLGLIERSASAFDGTSPDDIKQIYVFSDMLQSTQNPARDMAKPFTSKDVAIAAAKQDIEWLEKNRTINKGNLQNVTVTVIPPDAAMSSGPGGAELRDYWSTVFTHFGMTMKW